MINAIQLIKNDLSRMKHPLSRDEASDDNSLQTRTRKLLIGFFVLMLALTIVSRAVDSITIAQVVTQHPQGSMLTFVADGTGKITSQAKKYIRIQEGISIDRMNATIGQEVKKGDVLLTLNKTDIENALVSAEIEIEKSKNQIEQEQLSVTNTYISDLENNELLYHKAKKALVDSKEDYLTAKSLCREKTALLDKAKENYKKAMSKSTQDLLRDKKQELAELEASSDEQALTNATAFQTASHSLEAAKDAIRELDKKDLALLNYLTEYESKDDKRMQEALDGLLCIAYGDEDAYEKHKKVVIDLKKKLDRAIEDNTYSDKSSYQDDVAARRAVVDARADLAAENEKDTLIRNELNNYLEGKEKNDSEKTDAALLKINQCIYGITGYPQHKAEKEKAANKITELQGDLTSLQKKNSIALSAAEGKLALMRKLIESLKNGTYDPATAVTSEKQALDSAKQELRAQKQVVITAQRAIETAQASLLAAKLDCKQSNQKDANNSRSLERLLAAKDLRISSLQLTIKEKQQTISALISLKQNKGKIIAPVDGTIDSILAEAGKKTTADSSISINTGHFGITVTIPKEEGEYVCVGNEMILTQKGKKDTISVNVEGLRYTTDTQGNEIAEISAVMPKGDYFPGSVLGAKITNTSDLYDICLPLEAIRSDFSGTYCLIVSTKDTVLGKELLAVKVPIKILDKDAQTAAVSGSFSSGDNVIISSNKSISEGDRVRDKQ